MDLVCRCHDGYDAHHQAASAAVVKDLVLVLRSHCEKGYRNYWLRRTSDEVLVLAVEHIVVAYFEVGIVQALFQANYHEPVIAEVSSHLLSGNGLARS